MKKSFLFLAGIVMVLIFSFGFTNEEVGAKVGAYAPNISLLDNGKTIDIERFRGEYLLLTFWSSYDASSRYMCNEYETFLKSNSKSINYLSVNLDESETLFSEVLKLDNLNNDSQIFAGNRNYNQIDKFYDLKAGYYSFLISKTGKIIAINPSVSELKNL